jgi:RecJ-like exonuclease
VKPEITENEIYRACIILSMIGLGIIHLSQAYIQPENVEIREIDETWVGKTVTVNASTNSYSEASEATFFSLKDSTGSIQAVDFENQSIPSSGEFTGYVDIYESNLQLVISNTNNS